MNSDTVAGSADPPGARSRQLRTAVLRSVSRSFYLSIRFLPADLREPIALAYLLARTTDTIADTAQIAASLRLEALKNLSDAIQGNASREMMISHLTAFTSLQNNAAERTLLNSLPDCLGWLDQIRSEDRHDVRTVLEKITRGQMLDLQRFDNPRQIRSLPTAADLDQYTYLVAGCVGEFWTRVGFRHLRDFASFMPERMLGLGKRYGMGLQLINILRDAGADLRAGRCYFPQDELGAAGVSAEQILSQPERFQPVYENWVQKAREHLVCGMQYSLAIRNRRVRAATVLPALIGARTLTLLRKAGGSVLNQTIKVPRREVRSMMASLAVHLGSRKSVQAIFEQANL